MPAIILWLAQLLARGTSTYNKRHLCSRQRYVKITDFIPGDRENFRRRRHILAAG